MGSAAASFQSAWCSWILIQNCSCKWQIFFDKTGANNQSLKYKRDLWDWFVRKISIPLAVNLKDRQVGRLQLRIISICGCFFCTICGWIWPQWSKSSFADNQICKKNSFYYLIAALKASMGEGVVERTQFIQL